VGIALLGLFLVITTASLTYNAFTAGREVPAESLYPGPYVELNGIKVAYRTWGTSGSPIVLVHGFAESTFAWSEVGPILGRDHRVYALDLTGFGYTQRVGPYTLDAWTNEVLAFIHAFDLVRPVVVGHSLGAAVVADVALEHPEMIGGIVLADGDGLSAGGPPGWLRSLIVDPYLTTMYRLVLGSGGIVGRVLDASYGPSHPPITPALLAEWTDPFRVQGAQAAVEAMIHSTQGIPGLSTSQLAQVRVPAYVLWGSQDDIDPVTSGQASAALMHAPFHELPGAGHLSMLEDPQAFARDVEQFEAGLK
jgi:pimeloyl-ACP methyl ester carboxylesterase